MKCTDSSEVMRLFAGQLPVERAELLTAHFAHCAKCAALRDDIGTMTARLRHDPSELDDPQAIDEVMTLIRMGKAERPEAISAKPTFWKSWQLWLVVPATAAATAILMMVLGAPGSELATDEFQARGAGTLNLDRWVSLQVFRATGHGYEPVHDVVAANDALAFAYLNQSGEALRHLAIFGVDDRGEVFWYYPPKSRTGDDSPSIAIHGGAQPIELPEQIAHELEPGPLRIFGVFSSLALSATGLEDLLRRDLSSAQTVTRLTRISLSDVGQHSVLLRVEPSPGKAD